MVAFGAMYATHRMALPVNMIVEAIARPYVTTFEGLDAPWSHLARFVPDLRVRRVLAGGAYVASEHMAGHHG